MTSHPVNQTALRRYGGCGKTPSHTQSNVCKTSRSHSNNGTADPFQLLVGVCRIESHENKLVWPPKWRSIVCVVCFLPDKHQRLSEMGKSPELHRLDLPTPVSSLCRGRAVPCHDSATVRSAKVFYQINYGGGEESLGLSAWASAPANRPG